jgi:hypothetical protein
VAKFDLAQLTEDRLRIVGELRDGNPFPLANYLARGGELHDDQREALIKYLRGEFPRSRGNVRRFSQQWNELKIRQRVIALQWHFALTEGGRGSFRKALEAYLAEDNRVSLETLRKYVKRGIPKDTLKLVDETRAEVLAHIKSTNE